METGLPRGRQPIALVGRTRSSRRPGRSSSDSVYQDFSLPTMSSSWQSLSLARSLFLSLSFSVFLAVATRKALRAVSLAPPLRPSAAFRCVSVHRPADLHPRQPVDWAPRRPIYAGRISAYGLPLRAMYRSRREDREETRLRSLAVPPDAKFPHSRVKSSCVSSF